ncbi:MAG: epoxyqueuosine reductase [Clostridia bacterium]|nr:epoxyqueuosine reductase [Clostridia bacterium]
MNICDLIKEKALSIGAYDVGFCALPKKIQGFEELNYAVSVVVKLSPAVISGIGDSPTHTYFHHYRTVNAFIDRLTLEIGMLLDKEGYLYACVPASQTVDRGNFTGLFQHKTAAVLSGLGTVGKSGLFLSEKYGPAVRLGTVLTNADLSDGFSQKTSRDACKNCRICVDSCPALAIKGESFDLENPEKLLIDQKACSDFMKKEFQHIGRGAVCGICISRCPKFKKTLIF